MFFRLRSRHFCWACLLVGLALLALAATPARAQTVSGTTFVDRNGNGLQDPGEEPLMGVTLRLAGQKDAGGAFDQTTASSGSGTFSFAPGNGCYLLDVTDPAGWRMSPARPEERAQGTSGYLAPTGVRRYGGSPQLLDKLLAGNVRYTALGDSIAVNFNTCFDTPTFWYAKEIQSRLNCVAAAPRVSLDQSAISGEHTDDLLVDDGDANNVFASIRNNVQLATISIIGNDLRGVDRPDGAPQSDINISAAEILDSRQNLQEILSSLVSELPGAEVELNTVYDNKAYNCATANTTDFHRQWLPIITQMLRDVAWGQQRRVTIAEAYSDFAHEDFLNSCNGFQDKICNFIGDGIHPKFSGYQIIREKVWEALDGVNLGPKDGQAATSQPAVHHGFLERAVRLYPSRYEVRNGAAVTTPEAAFSESDGGAGASIQLGLGTEEVRLSGFPDWYDEITPVKVVAGIRYRTTGTVTDDFYRVEASVDGAFRPAPGHDYTPVAWNYYTPIVGGGGPNAPPERPDYPTEKLLAVPNVANLREVTATLTKNPVFSADGRGYDWPAITSAELGTTQIRVNSAPVAGTPGDNFRVVVDVAYLDVYGTTKPRPPEVTRLNVTRRSDGGLDLTFDAASNAEQYNAYFGDVALLHASGSYSHGGGAPSRRFCNTATTSIGAGRLRTTIAAVDVPAIASYIVVTDRVSGVESPAGFTSSNVEIDRSQNVCP